jgi:RNA polymerase sigma factor (sigma-70 family)
LLVYILQNGGMDPFEKLLELCNASILKVTSKYYFKDFDRDDIFQEARSILVESIKTYRSDKGMDFISFYEMSLGNHLNMLVRREFTHKRKANMKAYSLDELVEKTGGHIQGVSPIMTQPEDAAIARETLDQYIDELSPFEKEVFLQFIGGITEEMISVKLECSLEKVKNAMYRCMIKYRNAVE